MRLEVHVLRAIEAFDRGDRDEALMHACIAIDGTSRNLYKVPKAGKKDYKSCIREYWWILEMFISPTFNLKDLKFIHLILYDGHNKQILNPDLADIIYHIYRCSDAHGEEIPHQFELFSFIDGFSTWHIYPENGVYRIPDNIIWGLIAISVFCNANSHIKTSGGHLLYWGREELGVPKTVFMVKDNWGQEDKLYALFLKYPMQRINIGDVFNHMR